MTFCSVSWPSSKASVDVSAEARRKEKFLEGKILVNGCLVFLEKSVEKITAQKGSSHDTDVGKLWEIVGQMGSYSRKISNRDYEGWRLRLWNFQRGYSRNSISKFQGFIKKGVEFPGIKKNSCGICMGAWFLASSVTQFCGISRVEALLCPKFRRVKWQYARVFFKFIARNSFM